MYTISLSDNEIKSLAWLTDRGYFPELFYDKMYTDEEEPEHREIQRVWNVPEYAAWSLLDLKEEDPDAFLACMGGELLDKVLKLYNEIV